MRFAAALLIAATLAGMAGAQTRNPRGTDRWRDLVIAEDAGKVDRLGEAWRASLAEARKAHGAELKRLGALVDPGAGRGGPPPAPGLYACRVVKLGSQGGIGLAFVAYPNFRCRVSLSPGGDLRLAKLTGSQRVEGLIFPDRPGRYVLVGSEGLDHDAAPGYGRSRVTDMVGVVERLGPDRWRLATPFPYAEADLELLDLRRLGN